MRLLHNTWNTKAKFSLSFGYGYGSFGEKVIAHISANISINLTGIGLLANKITSPRPSLLLTDHKIS